LRRWGGEGWAGDVANEALEAISVVGLDAGGGVEGEACLFAPELIGPELVRVGGARVGGAGGAEAGRGIDQARDRAARVGAQGDLRLERGGLDEGEQRIGVLGRAVVGRGVVLEDPSATEHALDAAHDVPLDAVELVGGQGGRRMEARPARRAADDVGAIQEERVEVDVQREGRPEALHEVHRARVGARDAQRIRALGFCTRCFGARRFGTRSFRVGAELEEALLFRAPPVGRGYGPQEGPGDGSAQAGIAGHAQAQRPGDREDPLPHGDGREHPLDEVRRNLGHPAPPARGAEGATLAREGDEQVGGAVGTVDPAEAVGGIAAGEEAAQLLLDVARESPAAVLVLEAGEERLEVLAHEAVERRRRGIAAEDLGPRWLPRCAAPHAGLDGSSAERWHPAAVSPAPSPPSRGPP